MKVSVPIYNNYIGENMRWVDYIQFAFRNLGGRAKYTDLYQEISIIRQEEFSQKWKATVRKTVENHCPESENFRGRAYFQWEGPGEYSLLKQENHFTESKINPNEQHKKYGKGGESDEHKKLKMYIAQNPSVINIPENVSAVTEFKFLTGDRVDVLFTSPENQIYVIEIELSGKTELMVGAHQVIKYRALANAYNGLGDKKVRGILVANITDYEAVNTFCRRFDIQTFSINI